jgi:hypothetical protein
MAGQAVRGTFNEGSRTSHGDHLDPIAPLG